MISLGLLGVEPILKQKHREKPVVVDPNGQAKLNPSIRCEFQSLDLPEQMRRHRLILKDF